MTLLFRTRCSSGAHRPLGEGRESWLESGAPSLKRLNTAVPNLLGSHLGPEGAKGTKQVCD